MLRNRGLTTGKVIDGLKVIDGRHQHKYDWYDLRDVAQMRLSSACRVDVALSIVRRKDVPTLAACSRTYGRVSEWNGEHLVPTGPLVCSQKCAAQIWWEKKRGDEREWEKIRKGKKNADGSKALVKGTPRSLKVAEKGVKTGHDFANLMSALMSDIIEGRVTPSVGNATCNAGGKLLKVVEMQYRYGSQRKWRISKDAGAVNWRVARLTANACCRRLTRKPLPTLGSSPKDWECHKGEP